MFVMDLRRHSTYGNAENVPALFGWNVPEFFVIDSRRISATSATPLALWGVAT